MFLWICMSQRLSEIVSNLFLSSGKLSFSILLNAYFMCENCYVMCLSISFFSFISQKTSNYGADGCLHDITLHALLRSIVSMNCGHPLKLARNVAHEESVSTSLILCGAACNNLISMVVTRCNLIFARNIACKVTSCAQPYLKQFTWLHISKKSALNLDLTWLELCWTLNLQVQLLQLCLTIVWTP